MKTVITQPASIIHRPSSIESHGPSLSTCLAALELLNRLDSIANLNPPALLTVFRLYCGERLSVSQVASRCRCSVGTVSNRLKLLHAKIGFSPAYIKKAPRLRSPNQCQAPDLNF
jgi:hypothetical protein